MTPRAAFKLVDETEIQHAIHLARKHNFDVIPIVRRGTIKKYWDQEAAQILPISNRHRTRHDASVEDVLPRLNDHLIQFVYYRSEVVGLVDLSDLNKPLGRLPWLHPMLECEQYIVTKADKNFKDEEIFAVLTKDAKESIRKRKEKARGEDLVIPLLAFAYFPEVLNAAVRLGIVHINENEIELLSDIRNKLVHPGRNLIEERKTDGKKLLDALKICRRILAHA